MRHFAALSAFLAASLLVAVLAPADDVYLEAAGPLQLTLVGLFYGLANPADGSWYIGQDIVGYPTRSWLAVADTGASACILGKTTQEMYEAAGSPIPLHPHPEVEFVDEGFGGFASFAVAEPVRMMIADFKTVHPYDMEDPALYTAYGPVGGPQPPSIKMAAALDHIGGLGIDIDIIGMSILEGRLLHVDPHYLELSRFIALMCAGTLEHPPPAPENVHALYIPVTMQDFFPDPQPVDVGAHPMLPMHIRRSASDPMATRTAIFDSGAGSNYVCESFAIEAGIDVSGDPDFIVTVGGLGPGQEERPGWYVDALMLDLGNGREGDRLVISNTGVVVIPNDAMPGDLDAILGNALFSQAMDELGLMYETPVFEWYVDMRDAENASIIVVLRPGPGDANSDGCVDGADYTGWADHYGQSGHPTWSQGGWTVANFTEDDAVDGADYTAWADNYGDGGSSVPEPAAMALLAIGGLALLKRAPSRSQCKAESRYPQARRRRIEHPQPPPD